MEGREFMSQELGDIRMMKGGIEKGVQGKKEEV